MHFWIDKRSQTCGFGRARVAASLGGSGVGLGFGHPPRRLASKSMVTPIHRLQSNDTIRPCLHNSNIINNYSVRTTNNSNNSNGNRNNRNRPNHNGSIPYQQQQHDNNHQHHHQHRHQNISVEHRSHNLQRSSAQAAVINNQDSHSTITLPHIHSGPSHAHDLEQGSLGGIGNMAAGPIVSCSHIGLANASSESQLLPSHLKCGMWASLVLASVFVAGAKFYFDHQGTGLEVLIFCAFSATFFLAACTVSLCRLPRDLTSSPSVSVDGHSRGLDGQLHHSHGVAGGSGGVIGTTGHQILPQGTTDQIGQDLTMMHHSTATATITAPPPPYHIAILLPPENGKEVQFDETPPPSYDKILI